MRIRLLGALLLIVCLAVASTGQAAPRLSTDRRIPRGVPAGFKPAIARARSGLYIVQMRAPSVADRILADRSMSASAQRAALGSARSSQVVALRAAHGLGGRVAYRYGRLFNGFSARMSGHAAATLAARSDVGSVTPAAIVRRENSTSVGFIGATKVWKKYSVKGKGVTIAVIDTGTDYTHKDFGGPGTPGAYAANNPRFIEPGSFPTNKVIGGHDFVGEDFDVEDTDPGNDVPEPDADPLDLEGHGTHVAGTCCGSGVKGKIGAGVAPKAKVYSLKVFAQGSTTADVIIAALERAIDPDQDGNLKDMVDIASMSLGADYGTLNSPDAQTAQAAVDLGMVVVAAAGNAGNQPAGGFAYIHGTPAAARGVISVAASIDEFQALQLEVDAPGGVALPDGALAVHQDWSAPLGNGLSGEVMDARAIEPTTIPGVPSPADRQLCDDTPGGQPFAGTIALVYKGSTDAGDCDGTEKAFRAQEAGAEAVLFWSGFGSIPFSLAPGEFAGDITIPAVMVSTDDGASLADADSPGTPDTYDTGGLAITVDPDPKVFPGFGDRVTDFSSEGPANLTGDLKPEITAPGFNIESALAGSGDKPLVISGTSMSTPHISGAAALLRQLHPNMSAAKIKALLLNSATRSMRDSNGNFPVSATVMGAGRVRVKHSAQAQSVAWPGTLSYGVNYLTKGDTMVRSFRLKNLDDHRLAYTVSSHVRYSDFDPAIATTKVARKKGPWRDELDFTLRGGEKTRMRMRLKLHPSVVSPPEQEYGWVGFHGNVDGVVGIQQSSGRQSDFAGYGVAWHTAPAPSSKTKVNESSLDLTGGGSTLTVDPGSAAGLPQADFYLLGAVDDPDSRGPEDITHMGARSFVGNKVDGDPEGLPTGAEPLLQLGYRDFFAAESFPAEPVEFGVRTYSIHNTTDSVEVDVLIDVDADGQFADPELKADFIIAKLGPFVCVFDLSNPNPFEECSAAYFQNYDLYDSNLFGLIVDAAAIGLDGDVEFSYSIAACDLSFEVPSCDEAGTIQEGANTYPARIDVEDPAVAASPAVCGGFWADVCGQVTVSPGPAPAGAEPALLVLFANNRPTHTATVIPVVE